MVQSDSKQGEKPNGQDEKVDLRKHRKRLTTPEEKEYIYQMRKKYAEEDLAEKMAKLSEKQSV
jgi:cystathionine beta-lyase/cystathionine gamma-synthase